MPTRSNRGKIVLETTLLELVSMMSSVEKSDEAVVAEVADLTRSGDVKLTGTFRDVPVGQLFPA
jgi:hypothetical protein